MIEIHTLGWAGSRPAESKDEANVNLYVRVFIDGFEIPQVLRTRVYNSNDFGTVMIALVGPAEIITHTQDSWNALPA